MKKKTYVKPVLNSEEFVPQEYCSACGDTVTGNYLFSCDAGGGPTGNIYQETNGVPGLQKKGKLWEYKKDECLGGFYACGKTHEAPTTDVFPQGYYVQTKDNGTSFWPDYVEIGNPIPVRIWRGRRGNELHATEKLNQESWELAKS